MREPVTLFHVSSSYYSGIARLALIEKGIPFNSQILDIHFNLEQFKPEYVTLNPNMTVPTLIHHDTILTSSDEIIFYLDKNFEGPSLQPASSQDNKALHDWIDKHYNISIETITMGTLLEKSDFLKRKIIKTLHKEQALCHDLSLEFPELSMYYQAKKNIIDNRLQTFSPAHLTERKNAEFEKAIQLLDAVENQLQDREYLLKEYSLADLVMTVFLSRFVFLHEEKRLFSSRENLKQYWTRLQERPSFHQANLWIKPHPLQLLEQVLTGYLRHIGLSKKIARRLD